MESAIKNKQLLLGRGFGQIIGHNGSRLGEVAEHKTSLENYKCLNYR